MARVRCCPYPCADGPRLAGELQSVDGYMNIALENTEEYINGELKQSYGDAFVRGNNGLINSSRRVLCMWGSWS